MEREEELVCCRRERESGRRVQEGENLSPVLEHIQDQCASAVTCLSPGLSANAVESCHVLAIYWTHGNSVRSKFSHRCGNPLGKTVSREA